VVLQCPPEEWLVGAPAAEYARSRLIGQLTAFAPDAERLVLCAIKVPQPHLDSNQRDAYRELVKLLASLEQGTLELLWHDWMASPSQHLHMLVPDTFRLLALKPHALAVQLLEWGIAYPDPSFNRDFLEAAHEVVGSEDTSSRLLRHLDNVAAAAYWLLPLLSRDRAQPTLLSNLKQLRRRLRPFAGYLRQWWQWW